MIKDFIDNSIGNNSIRKLLCIFLCSLWFICGAYGQTNNLIAERVTALEKEFLLGDIHKKARVLESSAYLKEDGASLYTDALNFVCDYSELLKDEDGMKELAISAAKYSPMAIGDVSIQLLSIFECWEDSDVHEAVLEAFPKLTYYGYESAAVFNRYALKLLEDDEQQWNYRLMERVLSAMQAIDDSSSFDIYFAYYALPENEHTAPLRNIARKTLLAASEEHLAWFSSMIDSGNSQYQKSALQFILENNGFSDFFRAEMAEKALQSAIFIAEETDELCQDDVGLQLLALNELRRLSWTRASSLVQRLFPVAIEELENGFMTEDEFVQVVYGVQELASLRAGILISDFLKMMNTRAEKGDFYSQTLVLAVIQSLGALGDKIAFDSLLYVSYLPYPESVVEASREALARLKW